jgi:hypothetical protein
LRFNQQESTKELFLQILKILRLQFLASTEAYGKIAAPTILFGIFLEKATEAGVKGWLSDFV